MPHDLKNVYLKKQEFLEVIGFFRYWHCHNSRAIHLVNSMLILQYFFDTHTFSITQHGMSLPWHLMNGGVILLSMTMTMSVTTNASVSEIQKLNLKKKKKTTKKKLGSCTYGVWIWTHSVCLGLQLTMGFCSVLVKVIFLQHEFIQRKEPWWLIGTHTENLKHTHAHTHTRARTHTHTHTHTHTIFQTRKHLVLVAVHSQQHDNSNTLSG